MKLLLLLAAIVIALLAGGCAQMSPNGPNAEPAQQEMKKMASAGGAGGAPASKQDYDDSPAANQPVKAALAAMSEVQPDRFLIKNATVTLESKDVRKATDALASSVTAARGYVSDTHESVDALGARSITITVRVPASRFESSMQELEKLGKVLDRQVTSEDVTEEFVDSQSRLRNLKTTEGRLLEHLGRTGKLADTLLVEKELARVRLDSEQLEGRIRFLAHRIAYSTLAVTIRETAHQQAMVPPESFSSGKIASDASRSLVGFAQSVWSVAIWLGIWAVVWAPALVVAWSLRRRMNTTRYAA